MHFRTSGTRFLSGTLVLCAVALALASCGATTTNVTTASPSPTAMLAATATLPPIPTVPSVVKSAQFTCPEMVDGSDKSITDSTILLTVAYPGSWKETHCTRTLLSDGSITYWIGNYVHITAVPDTSVTVQQWVDEHKTSYETITLQPVAVRQAQEAVIVTDQLDQSAPSPFDFNFAQIKALLRGSHFLYELSTPLDVAYDDTSVDTVIPGPLRDYISGLVGSVGRHVRWRPLQVARMIRVLHGRFQ